MKLSPSEEQLMHHLWKLEKATMKELLECYEDPKPAQTTVATLLKRIREKGYIEFETAGKARTYFPMVKRSTYFGRHLKSLIHNFFGDSAAQFASFFTKETDLTEAELKALKAEIDRELAKKTLDK